MISLFAILQKSYATGWLVAAPIGPVNLEIIRRGLRDRLLSGFLVGLGACCVDAVYLSVFSLGLGAVLRVRVAQGAAFVAGGLVLCWIGVEALLDARRYWRGRGEPEGGIGMRLAGERSERSDRSDGSDGSDGSERSGGSGAAGGGGEEGRTSEARGANSAEPGELGEAGALRKAEGTAEFAGSGEQMGSGASGLRRFSRRPLGSYLVGIGMTAMNPMTIAFWSALALEFANLPVAHRLVATIGVLAGTMSWVLLLTALLGFARRWVGPRMFAFVTLAGGTVVLFFGVRFLWRGLAVEHWLAGWLS